MESGDGVGVLEGSDDPAPAIDSLGVAKGCASSSLEEGLSTEGSSKVLGGMLLEERVEMFGVSIAPATNVRLCDNSSSSSVSSDRILNVGSLNVVHLPSRSLGGGCLDPLIASEAAHQIIVARVSRSLCRSYPRTDLGPRRTGSDRLRHVQLGVEVGGLHVREISRIDP